jgi:GxxExxY protein
LLKKTIRNKTTESTENSIIVELKAVNKITPVHEAQLLSYLKLSGKRLGLLINFNVMLLKDGITCRID